MEPERFYAGIGSRETPKDVCELMTEIARVLRARGYKLRSGGARGADTAFALGAAESAVIYLPWEGFKIVHTEATLIACGDDPRLRSIAQRLHPAWHACRRGARALHTRNVAQILGHRESDPVSKFVVCWTPDASGAGGTGGALRVANEHNVPIFDLAREKAFRELMQHVALAA